MNPPQKSIGQYLLDRLYALGVHHIFGLPGDYVLRLDKLIEEHPIQFINTTRENTAGYMADAYARLKGLGAACITYGVGINIVNALSQAYVERSPIVVISGTAGTEETLKGQKLHHLINKSSIGGLDSTQLEIFSHVTVDQAVLNDPETASAAIDRVLTHCLYHQRPVYIEIPRDRVETPLGNPAKFWFTEPQSNPDALQEALDETREILLRAKRPLIWAGHELQRFGLVEPMLKFAKKYQIPIVTSLLGKTVIDEKDPLFAGVYWGGMSKQEVLDVVDDSDCAFVLGVILSDVDTGIFTAKLAEKHQVFADRETLSIRHHQYKNVLFEDYIHSLTTINSKKTTQKISCSHPKKERFKAKTGKKITAARLFECLQSHLTEEHIVVTDVGDCLFGAADLTLEQDSFLACAYFATLGFGVPGAISAQIACPKRRIVAIVGDGAFQMTGMELSTAVRYKADPVVIVMNNHGYGTERPLLEGNYNDLQDWNYSELPKVLGGGTGVRVAVEDEIENALRKALSTRGSFQLIEVELDKTDFSPALKRFAKVLSNKTR